MKRIFLHIGTGKTGTSAIQACLAENMTGLKRQGILYPTHEALAVCGADLPSSGNGGHVLQYLVPGGRPATLDEAKFLENFAGAMAGPEHTIVVSNEMLEYGDAQKLAELRDFCSGKASEIKIVYLIRDIAAHAFSAWRQVATHHGYTDSWAEFQTYYASHVNMFEPTLRKFASIFSQENIVVANYSSLGTRTTEWFIATIGGDYSSCKPAHEVNRSSSLESVAIMLEFNRCLQDLLGGSADHPALRGPFFTAMHRVIDSRQITESRISFGSDECNLLKVRLEKSLEWINTVYLPSDPIQIARSDQVGTLLQMPELTPGGRQAVREAVKLIIANSKVAVGQNTPLAAQLEDILGSTPLFTGNQPGAV
jgi:hypothetical protein